MKVPDGTYKAVAMPGAVVTQTASGKEYVSVEFKITQGELAGEVLPWSGWMHTEKTAARTSSSLKAMGWGGDLRDLSGLDNEVDVVVQNEEYQGQTTSRVAWVNTPKKPLDESRMAALEARLKKSKSVEPSDPFGPE